jgi:translation initiation factor 2 gamma subunit (eIF-2gamma)
MRNNKATVIPISALKKEGIEEVCRFIESKVSEWRK